MNSGEENEGWGKSNNAEMDKEMCNRNYWKGGRDSAGYLLTEKDLAE